MRDVLGPGTMLGYCTNVHPGATLEEIMANLERHAVRVSRRFSHGEPFGVGLWIPHPVSARLNRRPKQLEMLGAWLRGRQLEVFTLNGFPYDHFHAECVKHAVYRPDWTTQERSSYTTCLAHVLAALPGGRERSISTLPIGWPARSDLPIDLDLAARRVVRTTSALRWGKKETGNDFHLDLEPEPGCLLQRSDDVIRFFQEQVIPCARAHHIDESIVRTHLRIGHDICHAAVMFEDQAEVLAKYRAAGIRVGKVQISSAIRADLRNRSARERADVLAQLRAFREPRYLHQTMIADGTERRFFEDLPLAFDDYGRTDRAGDEWRVHFHVPVFLREIGALQTTQAEILSFFRAIRPEDDIHHFEVETYAWDVLPPEVRASLGIADLADGIARELEWVRDVAAREVAQ